MKPAPDRGRIAERFRSAVNMSAEEIENWLETAESRAVGCVHPGETESVGRQAGRRIALILRMPEEALDEEDYALMRKAAGLVARLRAQEPANPVTSRWRYALMNWGCDPLKDWA